MPFDLMNMGQMQAPPQMMAAATAPPMPMMQQPQQQLPMPEMQVEQMQAPQMMMPANYNPYLDALKSPLMDQKNMQKLQPIYDRYVDHLTNGNKADKYEDTATRIFGGLIAPAMAMFGKPGMSAAGAQLIGQAQQDIKAARSTKTAEQQHSLAAIKGLIDISKSGMQPAIQHLKAINSIENQKRLFEKDANKVASDQAKLGFREKRAQATDAYHKSLVDLRSRGLDINESKMTQALELAKMNDTRIRDIAAVNMQLQKRGQDINLLNHKENLLKAYRQDAMRLEQFNSEIAAKVTEKDAKGNYKMSGPDGKPIDPATLQLQMTGGGAQLEEPTDDHLNAAMQEVMQQQPSTRPQGQQVAPQQIQAAQANRFQQLVQQGVSPDQAAQFYLQSASKKGMPLAQALQALKGMGYGK